MGSPKYQRLTVDSVDAMEMSITSFITQGFTVVNKTASSATLQKKKEFKALWAVIGFLLCLLPLLIYLIVYAVQADVEVVEIKVLPAATSPA